MFAQELTTDNPAAKLIKPDIARDGLLGKTWLSGEQGRATLEAMGVPAADIHEPTLEEEQDRIKTFLQAEDQYTWMIEYKGSVVGAIWVNRQATAYLAAPSVHFMIGEVAARRKGVGTSALRAVLTWLARRDEKVIYSRYLLHNVASAALQHKLGFQAAGDVYEDEQGQQWQNVVYHFGGFSKIPIVVKRHNEIGTFV